MRTTIIGGHGKVALRLAMLLGVRGHDVTAWVRNLHHVADVEAAGATALLADVEHLDVAEMSSRLIGQDAVVWSAGAGGGDPARTYAVDRDAAIRSIDAALAAGVPRYVMVSYFYARPDHGVPPESAFYPYAEAKAAADRYLEQTDLAWTILGPSRLTDTPGTGLIETSLIENGTIAPASVSRDDVAAVAAHVLETPATVKRVIDFNNGSTPITEAL